MKEEWKVRQEVYHRLNQSHDDDLSLHPVEISKNIVEDAVKYFTTTELGWVYPAKSYVVGICYSKWLAIEFGGDPTDYLDDPELLYGNDPYFISYSADPSSYHSILNAIGGWDFDEEQGIVPDVKNYFKEEFML